MRGRAVFALSLLLVLTPVFAPQLSACRTCSCRRPVAPQEELARAKAVFSGRVEAISIDDSIPPLDTTWSPAQERAWSDRLAEARQIRLHVLRVWKGQVGETAVVVTGAGGPDCSYEFAPGGEYLVYAFPSRTGGLYASTCSRTRPLTNAAEESQQLGPGWPVARPSGFTQRPHN